MLVESGTRLGHYEILARSVQAGWARYTGLETRRWIVM